MSVLIVGRMSYTWTYFFLKASKAFSSSSLYFLKNKSSSVNENLMNSAAYNVMYT